MNKKEVYNDIDKHLIEDKKPSDYFNKIVEMDVFQNYPFSVLVSLKKVPQSPKYHPEGSVWNHTMLVVDNAAQRRNLSNHPREFMWASLLHDIGKSVTTKVRKGRITSYEHDIEGSILARKFLEEFTEDKDFINRVTALVRWHMQYLFVTKDLPFSDIEKMLMEVSINEIALLSLCDRLGRGELTEDKCKEEERNIELFKVKCSTKVRV